MVAPLDLDDVNLDKFYKFKEQCEDYLNPIIDGENNWTSINSCSSNSDDMPWKLAA